MVSPAANASTIGSARPATPRRTGLGTVRSRSSSCPHVATESPFTATMRSPRRSVPSGAASGGNSLTRTLSTAVVARRSGSSAPAYASTVYTTNANAMFIVTPARMTTIRCHTGFRSKARAGSTGTVALPPSSSPARPSSSRPAIFTYPPTGSHEMQYSVSPHRTLTTGRPKPSEKRST